MEEEGTGTSTDPISGVLLDAIVWMRSNRALNISAYMQVQLNYSLLHYKKYNEWQFSKAYVA